MDDPTLLERVGLSARILSQGLTPAEQEEVGVTMPGFRVCKDDSDVYISLDNGRHEVTLAELSQFIEKWGDCRARRRRLTDWVVDFALFFVWRLHALPNIAVYGTSDVYSLRRMARGKRGSLKARHLARKCAGQGQHVAYVLGDDNARKRVAAAIWVCYDADIRHFYFTVLDIDNACATSSCLPRVIVYDTLGVPEGAETADLDVWTAAGLAPMQDCPIRTTAADITQDDGYSCGYHTVIRARWVCECLSRIRGHRQPLSSTSHFATQTRACCHLDADDFDALLRDIVRRALLIYYHVTHRC